MVSMNSDELREKMQSDRRKAISRFIESNRNGLRIVDFPENKDSKKIYFVRSNIKKHRHNRVSMKKQMVYMDTDSIIFARIPIMLRLKYKIKKLKSKYNQWWNERLENANRIAFNITSSNQEAMEKVLNIGKKKK
jgi:hypothetical protein